MKKNIGAFLRKGLLSAIFLACLSSQTFGQTDILVTYYDGTEQPYSIQESGKLYFDASNLLVAIDNNTTATSIPLSIIRKITFASNNTAGMDEVKGNDNITVFPNPSSDYFVINSQTSENLEVKIYSLAGQLLLSDDHYTAGQSISVSHFNSGIYVLTVNDKSFKLMKL